MTKNTEHTPQETVVKSAEALAEGMSKYEMKSDDSYEVLIEKAKKWDKLNEIYSSEYLDCVIAGTAFFEDNE